MDNDKLTLEFEDGGSLELKILFAFDVNGREYIALEAEEENEIYLYRYAEREDGFELTNIEDDEELEEAGKVFDAIMESEEA